MAMSYVLTTCWYILPRLSSRVNKRAQTRPTERPHLSAKRLNYGFFYIGNLNNPEALKKWLIVGGMIVVTIALRTGISYPRVMLVVYIGLLYRLIDFS
jgi:hypothetical protein